MRIFLRRGKAFVPQQFLDGAQIGAGTEHVGGKSMSQRMRMNLQSLGQVPDIAIHEVSHAAAGQPRSPEIQEHGLRRRRVLFGVPLARLHQISPCLEVRLNGFRRAPAKRDDALLPAFADDSHKPLAETDISQIQRNQFAGPESRAIKQFENGPITLPEIRASYPALP